MWWKRVGSKLWFSKNHLIVDHSEGYSGKFIRHLSVIPALAAFDEGFLALEAIGFSGDSNISWRGMRVIERTPVGASPIVDDHP